MTKKDHHTKKLKYKHADFERERTKPKRKYDKHASVKSVKNISVTDLDYLEDLFEEDE